MAANVDTLEGSMPLWRKLLLWLLVPFALPVTILVLSPLLLLGVLIPVLMPIGEMLMWPWMWRRGRVLPRRERKRRLAGGEGTLIVEIPYAGWNLKRAWWTADDVLARAPATPPNPDDPNSYVDHPFLRWAVAEYTDLRIGKAFLLSAWRGESVRRQLLLRTYPDLKNVELYSGFVNIMSVAPGDSA